ncbi:MAG: hypothetical protein JW774_02815 [Candidatus Aureabacteria bacterium]|nr:hypothetical protein [Candidatus Auribacterota bacterium]
MKKNDILFLLIVISMAVPFSLGYLRPLDSSSPSAVSIVTPVVLPTAMEPQAAATQPQKKIQEKPPKAECQKAPTSELVQGKILPADTQTIRRLIKHKNLSDHEALYYHQVKTKTEKNNS